MKLDQLVYFLEAAKLEHIGKAGKILGISPSAITHSISSLEEEIGQPLFSKVGKRIMLTNHGKILAERAQYLLGEVGRIKEELTAPTAELQGHYRLCASHMLLENYLLPSWADLLKNHPKLSSEIYPMRSAEVLKQVSEGSMDFGFCFCPQSSPNFIEEILLEGQLVIVCRKGHPLSHISPKEQIQELSKYTAALPKSYQGIQNCETHPMFQRYGIKAPLGIIYDSYFTAFHIIEQSDHWSLIPEFLVDRFYPQHLKIIPPDWDAPVWVSAIWPKNRILTSVLKFLITEVREKLTTNNRANLFS